MSSNPSQPPKQRYNRQYEALKLLMENFPGSKIIDDTTWEPTDHPLNKPAPLPPKKKRRRKGEAKVHKDQEGFDLD